MRLDWTPLDLPYRRGHFTISAEKSDRARTVLLAARAADGAVGLGEASPSARVVGTDTAAVLQRFEEARRSLGDQEVGADEDPPTGPWGSVRGPAACALDGALLDLWGQRRDAPVWDLLGLKRPRVPTSATISLGDPAAMADEARGHLDAGFGILKIKLGESVASDVARLEAVREAAPRATLRIDGNEGWDLAMATALLPSLSDLGVELIEQPLRRDASDADMQALTRAAGDHGVAHVLDERVHTAADAASIGERRLAHGVNLKLQKAGGLQNGLRLIETARAHDLKVMVGCFIETWAGIALALQACAQVDWVDLDGAWLLAQEPVVAKDRPFLEDGLLTASDAPGLGIEVAARHRTMLDGPATL